MRQTDIVIAGGGLAGSTAAAMLGRAGYGVVLVDPHETYPPDFRAEKIDGTQARILARTGLADAVLRAATLDGESWVARYGRLVEKRPGDQHGILYHTLVNTIRGRDSAQRHVHPRQGDGHRDERAAPERHARRAAKAISARLVIVANGLNVGLRHKLGMARHDVSKTHSIMLGFDLVPAGRASFPFPALTYYGERPGRPHRLHHAVSDWRDDAREPVRLSRDGRSVAARVPRSARARP